MNIDKQTVEKVAHLARLELAEDEKKKLIHDMNKILGFMDKLGEINTDGIEPLVYMTNEINVLRQDVIRQEVTHEQALLNAPRHDQDYFLVAKVIEK